MGETQLALARQNVARAGLQDRIELRKLAVQELRDEQAFDFAWVPAVFIPPEDVPAALARVHASLRPGGFAMVPVGTDERSQARGRRVDAGPLGQRARRRRSSVVAHGAGFEPRLLAASSWVAMAVGRRA